MASENENNPVMSVSIYVIHDTRRIKKKTSTYPVKLRLVIERRPKDFQTVFDLSVEDWEKLNAPRVSDSLQKVRNAINKIEVEATDFVAKMDSFSIYEFAKSFISAHPLFKKRTFKDDPKQTTEDHFDYTLYEKKFPILKEDRKPGTISFTYHDYIRRLIREERIGTAVSYHCSYVSLKKFRGNVSLTEITPSFLRQYEIEMVKGERSKILRPHRLGNEQRKKLSKTTIGIYLRALRAIFNEAIAGSLIKQSCYPFGKRKYQIPGGKNIKKALTLDRIEALFNYVPTCDGEQWGKDYWLFFYLANGMNPKDTALLKYRNIQDDFIVFNRAKIENTARSESKPISVFITEEITDIIERRGNKDKSPDNYIFPILEPSLTPLQEFDRIKNFIRLVNKWIKRICDNLNFDENVSTIVTRHTCATILRNSGASTEFIQETLGHLEKRTTENYLGGFVDETKKEFARKLTAFKSKQVLKTA